MAIVTGAIVLCGAATFALAAGGLDRGFGDRGTIEEDFAPQAEGAAASSISILPDDRFIVAGIADSQRQFAVARYTADGALDPTFSGDGRALYDEPSSSLISDVSVRSLADSRTVLSATVSNLDSGAEEIVITRLLADGAPDPAFGTAGTTRTTYGPDEFPGDTAIAPDSSVFALTQSDAGFHVRRFDPSGALDSTFGSGGLATVAVGARRLILGGISVDPDGRPVVSLGTAGDLHVIRLTARGAPDPAFAGDGIAVADVGRNDYGGDIAFDRRERLIVANSNNRRQSVVRFETDGTLDTSFGTNGAFSRPSSYGYISNVGDDPEGVVTDGNRVFLFAEGFGRPDDDFHLTALRPNGELDRRFSGNGKITVDFGGTDGPYAGGVQSNGRVILAGYRGEGSGAGNADLSFAIAGFRRR